MTQNNPTPLDALKVISAFAKAVSGGLFATTAIDSLLSKGTVKIAKESSMAFDKIAEIADEAVKAEEGK